MAKASTEKLYLLNEADMAVLRRLIDAEKRKPQNRPGPGEQPSEDNQRSGIFALIPVGGIPARTDNGDGTYTLHGVECQMYQEVWDDLDQRTLEIVEGWEEYVVNHSDSEVAAGSLLPTEVTAQGTRFPVVGGGGVGHVVIRFKILSTGPFANENWINCSTVLAEVLDVSCNGAGVAVGDEVVIWDPSGCQFNIPADILVDMHGTAVKMTWGTSLGTGTGTAFPSNGGVSDCVDSLESGTGWVAGECWWMVQTLCCGEDVYY